MTRWRHVVALICLLGGPVAARACDVALVLAVDVSGSISQAEYDLQMIGMADALDDPEISSALVANRIALLLMQWSGAGRQVVSVPWSQIENGNDLAAFAQKVRATPRAWQHFSTAIGEAIAFAQVQFANAPNCARNVIDISGDGITNEGRDVADARAAVLATGTIVNGLAIENSVDGLADYFREKVIVGQGSFVIKATGYRDYPRAIRRKLLTEVVRPSS